MARSKQQSAEGIARYSSRKAALVTSKNHLPWRTRTKRKIFKRSNAEKKALAEQRMDRKIAYRDALSQAADVIHNEAVKLHEQFGTHSVDYYLQDILQQSRLSRGSRSVSNWNVFLRREARCINNGKLTLILYIILNGC